MKKNELRRNLMVSCITVLICLVIAEVGWRFYLLRTGKGFFDNPREFISPFFTTYAEPMPFQTKEAFYFLRGEVPVQKAPNEVRIICFGGSTTVNLRAGISYAEILDSRFAAYGNGYKVRVLNAGGEGFSSAHTLVNFALRNLDVQPDIITVFHNINDLSAVWVGDSLLSDYGNKYKTDFYLGMRHRTGLLAAVAKVSRLARYSISKINALEFPVYKEYYDRDYTLGLQYFRRNLKNIVAIAKTNGIRVVLVSQPAASELRSEQAFADYNNAIKLLADETDVSFIDLANTMTEDRLFLSDHLHYTREGVEKVAELFFMPLKGMVDEVIANRLNQDMTSEIEGSAQ